MKKINWNKCDNVVGLIVRVIFCACLFMLGAIGLMTGSIFVMLSGELIYRALLLGLIGRPIFFGIGWAIVSGFFFFMAVKGWLYWLNKT